MEQIAPRTAAHERKRQSQKTPFASFRSSIPLTGCILQIGARQVSASKSRFKEARGEHRVRPLRPGAAETDLGSTEGARDPTTPCTDVPDENYQC